MKFKKIRDVCVFKNNLRGKKFQEIRNLNDNFGNFIIVISKVISYIFFFFFFFFRYIKTSQNFEFFQIQKKFVF